MDYNTTLSVLTSAGTIMAQVGAIVLALMQIVKQFNVPKRYLPIFAIVFAVVLTCLFGGFSKMAVIVGLVTGLSAMGLFTGGKTIITK